MGLTEDINALNKRISSLDKKQEEVNRVLAVEEHKLAELQNQLEGEGYDVSQMTQEDLEALLDKLATKVEAEQSKLDKVLSEAEEKFAKFQELR